MTKDSLATAGAMLAAAVLLSAAPAHTLTCTDLPAIPGSAINCTSSANCFAKAAGSPCGSNQKCVAYARRLFSACCTCPTPGPAATASLKCAGEQTKAEAKFVQCHVRESARASLKGLQPDFSRCIERLQATLVRIDTRFGADCPQGATAAVIINTYAALLGQTAIDPQTVLLCAPPAQWNPVPQLCVASCP